MPLGKPANTRCIQLDDDDGCKIFGHPERPLVCASLQPSLEMCGQSRVEALLFLSELDRLTAPPASIAPVLSSALYIDRGASENAECIDLPTSVVRGSL